MVFMGKKKSVSLGFFGGLAVLLPVIFLISYFLKIDFFKVLFYAFTASFVFLFAIIGIFVAIIAFFVLLSRIFG